MAKKKAAPPKAKPLNKGECLLILETLLPSVREEVKKILDKTDGSPQNSVDIKLQEFFESSRNKTAEKAFAFGKFMNTVGEAAGKAEFTTKKQVKVLGVEVRKEKRVLTRDSRKNIQDVYDNLIGETTGSTDGKNFFIKNRGDTVKNKLLGEVYNLKYLGDDALTAKVNDFLLGKDADMDKRLWMYIESDDAGKKKMLDGKKISKQELKIADAVTKIGKDTYQLKTKSGYLDMKERKNYGVKHNHSADRITTNQDKWMKSLDESIDWVKSFDLNPKAPDFEARKIAVMKEWLVQANKGSPDPPGKLTNKKRGLVFLDKEMEYNYFAEFGVGKSLSQKLHLDVGRNSNDIAIGEKMGKNYADTLQKIEDFYDTEFGDILSKHRKYTVHQQLRAVSGKLNRPSFKTNGWAKSAQLAKNVLRLALLGKAHLAAINDVMAVAMNVNTNSGNSLVFDTYRVFKEVLDPRTMGKKGVKESASRFKILLEVERDNIMSKYGGDEMEAWGGSEKGTLEKATDYTVDKFMKYTGVEGIGNRVKEAGMRLNAENMKKAMNSKDPKFSQQLLMDEAGFKGDEVAIIKEAMTDPDGMFDVDLNTAEIALAQMPDGDPKKAQLASAIDKMHTFLMAKYNTTSAVGTLKSRTQLGGTAAKGDWLEEGIAFLGMFKAPLMDTQRIFMENWRTKGLDPNSGIANQTGFALMAMIEATVLSVGIDYLRNVEKTGMGATGDHESQQKWNEYMDKMNNAFTTGEGIEQIMIEGLLSSGIAGITGDLFGGGYQYAGSRFSERAMGPGFGIMGQTAKTAYDDVVRYRKSGELDFSKTMKKASRVIPGRNLPMVDPLINAWMRD